VIYRIFGQIPIKLWQKWNGKLKISKVVQPQLVVNFIIVLLVFMLSLSRIKSIKFQAPKLNLSFDIVDCFGKCKVSLDGRKFASHVTPLQEKSHKE
jgi:membrane protein required for beta-lactamase induction